MSNEQKLRDIANKWGFRVVAENADDPDTEFESIDDSDQLFSDLTALISEHYYPKEFAEWLCSAKLNRAERLYKYWMENESMERQMWRDIQKRDKEQ